MRRLLWLIPFLAGCLGTSPEDAEREALGPEVGYEDEGGPEHRPNQPCLVCHGEGGGAEEAVFVVAGTVYLRADDPVGLGGARVTILDAAGHAVVATSNRAGNFMVSARGGEEDEGGGVRIPFDLEYPLRVSVTYDAYEQVMRSAIHREGSCAACHGDEPGADSAGKIYLVEESAP